MKRTQRRQAACVVLDGGAQLPCVLWDLSETGARIAAARAGALPDMFGLFLNRDRNSPRFCRVAWRRGGQVGVQFVDEAVANIDLDPSPAWMRRKSTLPVQPANAAPTADINTSQLLLPGYGPLLTADAIAPSFRWSLIARAILLLLVAATVVFVVAGIEYEADWSVSLCSASAPFCQHPEWTGGAAIAMLLIYLAVSGMEE